MPGGQGRHAIFRAASAVWFGVGQSWGREVTWKLTEESKMFLREPVRAKDNEAIPVMP